ncbi:MAG: hypothetical protein S4CHLAM2_01320 [Chlamydiales bacterium]|nr:hypothetical protein [Chlamydiales bacterium]
MEYFKDKVNEMLVKLQLPENYAIRQKPILLACYLLSFD